MDFRDIQRVLKGETVGHEFHGNQHTGSLGSSAPPRQSDANRNQVSANRYKTPANRNQVDTGQTGKKPVDLDKLSWAQDKAQEILDGKMPIIPPDELLDFFRNVTALPPEFQTADATEISTETEGPRGPLLGDEGVGGNVARNEMPQIKESQRPEFVKMLETEHGVKTTEERVDPTTLSPFQKEMVAGNIGGIIEKNPNGLPDSSRILVSSDNIVIDGHHNWAAAVALHEGLDSHPNLPIYRVDMPAAKLIPIATKFGDDKGNERQGMVRKSELRRLVKKAHGKNAHGATKMILEMISAHARKRVRSIAKGDKPGHVFHGNQWTTGQGGAEMPENVAVFARNLKEFYDAGGKVERIDNNDKKMDKILSQVIELQGTPEYEKMDKRHQQGVRFLEQAALHAKVDAARQRGELPNPAGIVAAHLFVARNPEGKIVSAVNVTVSSGGLTSGYDVDGPEVGHVTIGYLGSTGEMPGAATSLMEQALQVAADKGLTVTYETTPDSQPYHDKLGVQTLNYRALRGFSPETAAEVAALPNPKPKIIKSEITKGDVVGHEFHGNQWTQVGASSEKVKAVQSRLARAAKKLTQKTFKEDNERLSWDTSLQKDRQADLEKLGYSSLEEYQKASAQAIKDFVARGDITVSIVTPEQNLIDILNSGEIQNGYVSGRSERSYASRPDFGTAKDVRMKAENLAFGLTMKSPLSERPVYGFVDSPGIQDDPNMFYGGAKIVLNSDLKERSTVTLGDSLDLSTGNNAAPFLFTTAPLLASDPNPNDIFYPSVSRSFGTTGIAEALEQRTGSLYVEAQIHGGIKLSDIAKVEFYKPPSDALIKALDAKGIPHDLAFVVRVTKGDLPGHDFRGNQYTGGKSGGENPKPARRPRATKQSDKTSFIALKSTKIVKDEGVDREWTSKGIQNEGIGKVKLSDGSEGVVKNCASRHEAKCEVLAAKVGKALGTPIRDAVRVEGIEPKVLSPLIEGITVADLSFPDEGEGAPEPPIDPRIELFDILTGNYDRNPGNIIITPDGNQVGIDHSVCFGGNDQNPSDTVSEMWKLDDFDTSALKWTPKQVEQYEENLKALAPDFSLARMDEEYGLMMDNWQKIVAKYRDDHRVGK